jgi:hypothetical protein
MRRVTYAGGDFTTSDEIAHLVLEYAAVLANKGRAATLSVPIRDVGKVSEVEVLVGPASQLTSEEVAGEEQIAGESEFSPTSVVESMRTPRGRRREPSIGTSTPDPRLLETVMDVSGELSDVAGAA